jgi:DNA-binding NarL/FixJ family response regulator
MLKTKILIVDDHRVVIEGIRGALREHAAFEVVGEALNGRQAVRQVESLGPDIVIMDISMPNLNGLDATRQIKKTSPETRIIIFTMYSNKEYIVDLFKSGVSAYVLKEDPMADLIHAIEVVANDRMYYTPLVHNFLVEHIQELEEGKIVRDELDTLSLREREIFCLLAEGKSIKEVAQQLFISPKTVETHKYNLMEKLDVHTIADITKLAIRKKLIQV